MTLQFQRDNTQQLVIDVTHRITRETMLTVQTALSLLRQKQDIYAYKHWVAWGSWKP